jgi:iron(III) transport system permease protein
MATAIVEQLPLSQRIVANIRRFFHWLSSPQVILALIMLAVMFYMVIVPLYRMVMTTITYSENDLRYAKGAVAGDFTLFHWVRMLTTKIGMMMTIQPLMHSLTI